APAPQALSESLDPNTGQAGLPGSVERDRSTYIHLLRTALKSGSSSQISLIVQSTFFLDHNLQTVH
ncbi:MAG: hypothetical protein ABJN46_05395, partial [Marinobacter sp.]